MSASYAGYLIYILLHHLCGVTAIPTHKHIPHNETASANKTTFRETEGIEKPWTPSPPRRGTNDILLSCAATIALAV